MPFTFLILPDVKPDNEKTLNMKDSDQVFKSDAEINISSENFFSPSNFFSVQCNIFLFYEKKIHVFKLTHKKKISL